MVFPTPPPLVVLVLALLVWVSLLELLAVVPVLDRYLSGSRTRLTNLTFIKGKVTYLFYVTNTRTMLPRILDLSKEAYCSAIVVDLPLAG
jgi:hypothetical protein